MAEKADGSVLIEFDTDVSDANKELEKLKKKIKSLENDISTSEQKKIPLVEQSRELGAALDEAKAKLYEMQNAARGTYSKTDISEQQERVRGLQAEWGRVQGTVERYDQKIANSEVALNEAKERARDLVTQINASSGAASRLSEATAQAEKQMKKFTSRLASLAKRVFVFTLITSALRSLRTWLWDAIKTNGEAVSAVAKLKGALLTLAQPLVEVIIPAFAKFVNILAALVTTIARFISKIFGTTAQASAEAAENLYNETEALDGVGSSAKKAAQKLAAFDEINTLSTSDDSSGGGAGVDIGPDFSAIKDENWLDNMLGGVASKVTAALLLGGIALIAIGACLGRLGLVLAGLLLLGTGVSIGEDAGVFASWADKLGLDGVTQYIAVALMLAGIVLVAIGAAKMSFATLIAGLGLLGVGITLAETSEKVQSWVETLGLDSVNEFVSIALVLGGIALIAIGACLGNILMVIAGIGLIGGGVAYANDETKGKWADNLGLDSVFDYVTAAMQLAGIALIAIGACLGNIAMVIAGGVILGLGVTADIIGEEKLKEWWEVLKLTTVQQWVSIALLLTGIALIAIGACMGNIVMILAGALALGVSYAAASEGTLKDWVTVMGLEKVTGWVTAALLLVGIALVVFGILTANIMMILAGAGMLGAGVTVGVTTGTFSTWLNSITSAFRSFKETMLEIFEGLGDGIKGVINGIIYGIEWLCNKVIDGINKVTSALNNLSFTIPDWVPVLGGKKFGFSIKQLSHVSIPRLAEGAVIPPNREFLAVLGDQRRGTNIETPLSTMVEAFKQAMAESGSNGTYTFVVNLDGREVARNTIRHMNDMTRERGKPVVLV